MNNLGALPGLQNLQVRLGLKNPLVPLMLKVSLGSLAEVAPLAGGILVRDSLAGVRLSQTSSVCLLGRDSLKWVHRSSMFSSLPPLQHRSCPRL